MAKYQTAQRRKLIEYLELHLDELVSSREIVEALAGEGISMSAVYRNLAELEAEGKVRRTTINGRRNGYYQYTAAKSCKDSLHLNCKVCGKAYHLNDELASVLVSGLKKTENFSIDKKETIIYGICDNCEE